MPFRESAEREVLLRQEQDFEAEATALEQQVRMIAYSGAGLRLLELTRERDRLNQETEKLCDEKIAILQRRTGDPNQAVVVILMFCAVFLFFVLLLLSQHVF